MHKTYTTTALFLIATLFVVSCTASLSKDPLEVIEVGVDRYPVFPSNMDIISLSSSSDDYLYGMDYDDEDMFVVCVYHTGNERYEVYDTSDGMSSTSSYNGVGLSGSSDGETINGLQASTSAACYYPGTYDSLSLRPPNADWTGTLWVELNGGNDYIRHGHRTNNNWDLVTLGGSGIDSLLGTNGTDWLYGGPDGDHLYGYDRNDVLYGEQGPDVMYGGIGTDFMVGGDSADRMYGGQGADTMYGYPGNDTMEGGSENDKMWGGSGDDNMDGGTGTDTIRGEAHVSGDTCVNGPNIYTCELP